MQAHPVQQRWDQTTRIRVGMRIDTKRLLRSKSAPTRRVPYISPAAPSTLPLYFTESQQSRLFPKVTCEHCERECSPYNQECIATSSSAPSVPLEDTFVLSDACPQIGGAHGYVDLLKRTRIAIAHWPHFEDALRKAGINAHCLTTHDRLLAYVLWEAIMTPGMPGLGFAPGLSKAGGKLLFLDMKDQLRRPMEVDLFDFLRVLQVKILEGVLCRRVEKNARDQEQQQQQSMPTNRESASQGAEQHEEGEEDEDRHANSSSSLSTDIDTDLSEGANPGYSFLPPRDPIARRLGWCRRSGFTDLGNPYRKPCYRFYLDSHWEAKVLSLARAERRLAAWALAVAQDKQKGKGRLIDLDLESKDEHYYEQCFDGDEVSLSDPEESNDSPSDAAPHRSVKESVKYWSQAIRSLFTDEEVGDGDTTLKKREKIAKGLWNPLDILCGMKDDE